MDDPKAAIMHAAKIFSTFIGLSPKRLITLVQHPQSRTLPRSNETSNGHDHKNLLQACRRYLCLSRTSAVDQNCDGLVRHLEWLRCAVLGELDCRHRGGRVELPRLPRRHAQLKACQSSMALMHCMRISLMTSSPCAPCSLPRSRVRATSGSRRSLPELSSGPKCSSTENRAPRPPRSGWRSGSALRPVFAPSA